MEIFQAAVLGLVQGLTEFLPVSSTGHLIVVPWLFNWKGLVDTLPFDLALHVGTTIAVFGYFWKDWAAYSLAFLKAAPKGWNKVWENTESKLFSLLIIASIPAGVVGVILDKLAEDKLRSPVLVGGAMIVFAFVLLWADSLKFSKRRLESVTLADSIFIGFAQIVALIPGISRSGSTITGGLVRGLDRETAARFSFLLSAPVILGAALFKFKDVAAEGGLGGNLNVFLVGLAAAAISGWIAIKFLLTFVQKHNFRTFVVYRLIAGAVILLIASKR